MSTPTRILILDDYQGTSLDCADWSTLADAKVDVLRETLPDDAQRAERMKDYEVIVAMRERTPFSKALLGSLPKLRLLVTTGMRNSSIDMRACAERGVTVCGAPGSAASAGSTAEVAWALILGLAKHVPEGQAAMHAGHWQPQTTMSLPGKTIGIVGLGKLGQQMAKVAAAFGMNVQAWSPNLTPERAAAAGATAVDKKTLFATSDFVTLHLVLSAATAGVVTRDDIAGMRSTAYFINTSRAGLVESGALFEALKAGKIAGAGLDVFDTEPVQADDPLLTLPNVLASPHVGYVTDDNLRAFYGNAVRAIGAWQSGAPINVLGV
ncbi:D-2-hydroxyacid dehydrogenase family protein [soil metagenome]